MRKPEKDLRTLYGHTSEVTDRLRRTARWFSLPKQELHGDRRCSCVSLFGGVGFQPALYSAKKLVLKIGVKELFTV